MTLLDFTNPLDEKMESGVFAIWQPEMDEWVKQSVRLWIERETTKKNTIVYKVMRAFKELGYDEELCDGVEFKTLKEADAFLHSEKDWWDALAENYKEGIGFDGRRYFLNMKTMEKVIE